MTGVDSMFALFPVALAETVTEFQRELAELLPDGGDNRNGGAPGADDQKVNLENGEDEGDRKRLLLNGADEEAEGVVTNSSGGDVANVPANSSGEDEHNFKGVPTSGGAPGAEDDQKVHLKKGGDESPGPPARPSGGGEHDIVMSGEDERKGVEAPANSSGEDERKGDQDDAKKNGDGGDDHRKGEEGEAVEGEDDEGEAVEEEDNDGEEDEDEEEGDEEADDEGEEGGGEDAEGDSDYDDGAAMRTETLKRFFAADGHAGAPSPPNEEFHTITPGGVRSGIAGAKRAGSALSGLSPAGKRPRVGGSRSGGVTAASVATWNGVGASDLAFAVSDGESESSGGAETESSGAETGLPGGAESPRDFQVSVAPVVSPVSVSTPPPEEWRRALLRVADEFARSGAAPTKRIATAMAASVERGRGSADKLAAQSGALAEVAEKNEDAEALLRRVCVVQEMAARRLEGLESVAVLGFLSAAGAGPQRDLAETVSGWRGVLKPLFPEWYDGGGGLSAGGLTRSVALRADNVRAARGFFGGGTFSVRCRTRGRAAAVAEFARVVQPFHPEKARLAVTAKIAEMHGGELQELLRKRFAMKMSAVRKRFATAVLFWEAGVLAEAELQTLDDAMMHAGMNALADDAPRRLAAAAAEAGTGMKLALEYGDMAATCAAEESSGVRAGQTVHSATEKGREQFVSTANQMMSTDCADLWGSAETAVWERRWGRALKQTGAAGGVPKSRPGGVEESGVLRRFKEWPETHNWKMGGATESLGDFADPRRGVAALTQCLWLFAAMCLDRSEQRRQIRDGDVKLAGPRKKSKVLRTRGGGALPPEFLMPTSGLEAVRQLRDALQRRRTAVREGRRRGSTRKGCDGAGGGEPALLSGDRDAEDALDLVVAQETTSDGAMSALAERILSRAIAGVTEAGIGGTGERYA